MPEIELRQSSVHAANRPSSFTPLALRGPGSIDGTLGVRSDPGRRGDLCQPELSKRAPAGGFAPADPRPARRDPRPENPPLRVVLSENHRSY